VITLIPQLLGFALNSAPEIIELNSESEKIDSLEDELVEPDFSEELIMLTELED